MLVTLVTQQSVRRLGEVSVAPDITVALQTRFVRDLPEMGVRWQAEPFPELQLLALNQQLAGAAQHHVCRG